MRTASNSIGRSSSHFSRALAVLAALCLATLAGCGEEEGSGDSGVDTATQPRDVKFGHVTFTPVDDSGFYCPFEVPIFNFEITTPHTIVNDSYESPLGRGQSHAFGYRPGWGLLHGAPGDELCISVTTWHWADGEDEVCRTVETGSNELSFALDVPRLNAAPGCSVEIDVSARVEIFDASAFCGESCIDYRVCGRPGNEDCVATCLEALGDADVKESEICHDATRDWLTCLHEAPCGNENSERYCESNGQYAAQNALFSSGQCARPLPPPPPPDPAACDPRSSDIVAGEEGDFFVLARTRDFPSTKHFMVIDLSQLSEVDATLSASPNDPALSLARSILPTIKGLDGSLEDHCAEAGIVALRFEVDVGLATAAYADLDSQLASLQSRLEELPALAAAAKKQAVSYMMDVVICPVTGQAFGLLKPPYGTVAGAVAQSAIGCFD